MKGRLTIMKYQLYVARPIDWWDICHECVAPVVKWARFYGKQDELMAWLIDYFDGETPSMEEVDGALLTIKKSEYENILGKVG